MKKILSALLLLPLMAATFIACSSDDDITTEQPSTKTVTFIASLDPKTRIAFTDQGGKIKSRWENSTDKDLGKTVTFRSTSNDEYKDKVYTFTISVITTDGLKATLTYNNDNGIFPPSFKGIATYNVDAAETQVQTANGSFSESVAAATAHLHAGTMLETEEYKNLTDGSSVQFHHAGTSFFRVALKAPCNVTSGAELVVKATGEEIGRVQFNFSESVPKDGTLVAYLRTTAQQNAENLSYTLIQGNDTYSCTSTFQSSHDLEEGTYYYTDLTSKNLVYNSKKIYGLLGKAPVDVHPADFDIYLDAQGNVVDKNSPNAVKKVLISDRFLGTEYPGDDDCLYFYWGETVGHRVRAEAEKDNVGNIINKKGTLILNTGDPETFGYGSGENQYSSFNETRDIINKYCYNLNNDYLQVNEANTDYVLHNNHDAAKQIWGGNWRMLSVAEAQKMYDKATKRFQTRTYTLTIDQATHETREEDVLSALELESPNGDIIVFPAAGVVSGWTLMDSNTTTHPLGEHDYVSAIFSWTREPYHDSSWMMTNKAYLFGVQELNPLIDNSYHEEFGTDAKSFLYEGLPVIPCLIVPLN